ncbi:histidine phosphatase family protein [Shewanella sp. YIC-542]|uniref:histidine phosphatase family protein n=1 Tax=Shewanella mytili TaxID=3377111 RepID=UPI00398ECA00
MSCNRKLTIYLMRHGSGTEGDILRGRTDSPLSELGQEQMWDAWRELCNHLPEGQLLLLSSPAQCCSGFADNLVSEMPEFFAKPLQSADWLQERDLGEWNGKSAASLAQAYPAQSAAFFQNPLLYTPPQGETPEALKARVDHGWQTLVQGLLDSQQHSALLITHAGVLRTLISHLLNPQQPLLDGVFNALELPHGSLLKIEIDASQQDGNWQCQPKLHWQL